MPDLGSEGNFIDRLNRVVDRVEALERSQTTAIGRWRLSTAANGDLVAKNMNTEVTVVVAAQ